MLNQVILNIITAFVTFALSIFTFYRLQESRLKGTEDKLDIIWDYIINRAKVEFVTKKMGTIHSPPVVNDEVRDWYKPISHELKTLYKKIGIKFTDRELFVYIHRNFGDWITNNICIPYNLENGACIIAAIAVAKEDDAK